MALRAEIIGDGPGLARLQLRAPDPVDGAFRLQIRRNQGPDHYLSGDGRWQSTPEFWFTIAPADRVAVADGFDVAVGPQIVDPIVASLAGNAFQLALETTAGTQVAPLTIPQSPVLLASGAGVPEAPIAAIAEPEPARPAPTLAADPEQMAPVSTDLDDGSAGRRFWRRIAIVGVLVLLGLAVAGVIERDRILALIHGPEQPPAPQLTMLQQIQAFMAANPDRAPRLAKAQEKLSACELDWASALYRDLGTAGDADAATGMGRLYDPSEHLCPDVGAEKHPVSSDTAEFWYRKAIAAGSVEATRRLGAMLTAAGKDAPKFNEGIDLLKGARDKGDAEAAQKLKGLGQ